MTLDDCVAVGARFVRPTVARALAASVSTTVDRLAAWLLLAAGLDLLVTRFLVRLAIFIPKGEPAASASAVVGRVGAAVDALVPIVGLLVLGALLAEAGRRGRPLDAAIGIAIAVVAALGFALLVLPPTPAVVLGTQALIVLAAVGAVARWLGPVTAPVPGRAGMIALGASVACSAAARAGEVLLPGEIAAPALGAAAQAMFVLGALALGCTGLLRSIPGSRRGGLAIAAGLAVGLALLLASLAAPLTYGTMAIWSLGLSAAIPGPVLAVIAGIALAGLPRLHRAAPRVAIGGGIVLAAGCGLAASGLVLAGLLGLAVGSTAVQRRRG